MYLKDPKTNRMALHVIFKLGNDEITLSSMPASKANEQTRNTIINSPDAGIPKTDMSIIRTSTNNSVRGIKLYLKNGVIAYRVSNVRDTNVYQIESYAKIPSLLNFVIALSAITGPYARTKK